MPWNVEELADDVLCLKMAARKEGNKKRAAVLWRWHKRCAVYLARVESGQPTDDLRAIVAAVMREYDKALKTLAKK